MRKFQTIYWYIVYIYLLIIHVSRDFIRKEEIDLLSLMPFGIAFKVLLRNVVYCIL